MNDPLLDTSQVRVGSQVMFWAGAKPVSGTVIGFEDGGFMVETADDVTFVAAANCRPLDIALPT